MTKEDCININSGTMCPGFCDDCKNYISNGSTWLNTPQDITPYQGFCYEIECKITKKIYIGKKNFFKNIRADKLKGMTTAESNNLNDLKLELDFEKGNRTGRNKTKYELRVESKIATLKRNWKKRVAAVTSNSKRIIRKETDWKEYNTSSPLMQEKLLANPGGYEKRIVKLCTSKSDLAAWETYLILDYYTKGKWSLIFNECVQIRCRMPKVKG